MAKRIVFLGFLLLIAQLAMSHPALSAPATINPACVVPVIWYFPDQVPIGWWVYSAIGQGNYSYYIAACACPPPGDCPSCNLLVGKPISLGTGDTFIQQSDLKVPGLGGGLTLDRTWNSIWPGSLLTLQAGAFGVNWRSTYEERIVLGTDNYIKYLRSDGSFWSFVIKSGTTNWSVGAPANVTAMLSTDISVNPYYILTFQNGEQRRFDKNTGNLIAIIDRNGNTTTVGYDANGRLSTVTDAAGRQLTFSYGSSGNLVTSVTSSVGISLTYSYDSQARLSQITKPDSTTVNFAYNSQSLISSVTDSNGKVLESHTYDSQGRGLTSVRANGVESVTVS